VLYGACFAVSDHWYRGDKLLKPSNLSTLLSNSFQHPHLSTSGLYLKHLLLRTTQTTMNATMSESNSELLRGCIKTSRERCLVADYQGALATLSSVQTDSLSQAMILTEMARVHILNGNYKAAKAVYPLELCSGEQPNIKLLRIQKAYVEIITDCKLAEAVDIVREIWDSLEDELENCISEIEVRTLFFL